MFGPIFSYSCLGVNLQSDSLENGLIRMEKHFVFEMIAIRHTALHTMDYDK